jgi:hypothetical protein
MTDEHTIPLYQPDDFRILMVGVDTVYLSWAEQVTQDTFERLLREKEAAQEARNERNAAYCSEWLDARVYPTGANSGFSILIDKAKQWSIKLQKGNEQCPGVYLEMRSHALHTHPAGPWGATKEAVTWIRDTLFADAPPTVRERIVLGEEKLSRLDLHLDWQGGWEPSLTEVEVRQFIRPSRVKWQPHLEGDRCTGYAFGKKRIMARIYNKTIEATAKSNDEYFALIRQHAGDTYNPEQSIWRIEFELKREGAKGFALVTQQEDYDTATDDEQIEAELEGEDLPTIGTLKKALRYAPDLWRYLTTRWLRLTLPNGDQNKARWPVHPVWQQIQAGFSPLTDTLLSEEQCRLVREQRHNGRRRLINRLATAITTSAYLMMESDPTQAMRDFLAQMEHLAHKTAAYQQQKREQGRQRLSDKRQEQFAQNVEHLAHEAGGLFAIAGVLKQQLPKVAEMPDLLLAIAEDLDKLAQYKGGVPQMLYDKWCREYQVVPPKNLLRLPPQVTHHNKKEKNA